MIYSLIRIVRRQPNLAIFLGGTCLVIGPLCWALPAMMLDLIVKADESGGHPLARMFLQYSNPILRWSPFWYAYRFVAVSGIALIIAGIYGAIPVNDGHHVNPTIPNQDAGSKSN